MNKIVKTNEYAPFNAATLGTAKLGRLVLKEGKIGYDRVAKKDRIAIVGYKIEQVTIAELLKDPMYSTFRIPGKTKEYTLSGAVSLIEQAYTGGDLAKGKRYYIKLAKALREFNENKIAELSADMEFRLNRDTYLERVENYYRHKDERVRWDSLIREGNFTNKTPQALLDKINGLSEKNRELWLMRARDYGLEVPETTLHRKDVYTMRVAAVADAADSIHPFNIYHPVDETDPIKTFAGRHKQTVTFTADENEIIAIAMGLAQYGDEFMDKCRPLYDVIDRHWVLTKDIDTTNLTREEVLEMANNDELDAELVIEVLFTGTAEQCEAQLETLRLTHPNCSLVPSDKEITVREARLLGVTEDDRLLRRDFCYDAEDILD